MGQESIEKVSIEKYLTIWEKELVKEVEKQYLKDHFMLGCGWDEDKVEFYQLYLKTFCTDNCELSNWIWKKINGFLEDPKINCNTGQVTCLRYQPVQNITNIYNNYPTWNKVEW